MSNLAPVLPITIFGSATVPIPLSLKETALRILKLNPDQYYVPRRLADQQDPLQIVLQQIAQNGQLSQQVAQPIDHEDKTKNQKQQQHTLQSHSIEIHLKPDYQLVPQYLQQNHLLPSRTSVAKATVSLATYKISQKLLNHTEVLYQTNPAKDIQVPPPVLISPDKVKNVTDNNLISSSTTTKKTITTTASTDASTPYLPPLTNPQQHAFSTTTEHDQRLTNICNSDSSLDGLVISELTTTAADLAIADNSVTLDNSDTLFDSAATKCSTILIDSGTHHTIFPTYSTSLANLDPHPYTAANSTPTAYSVNLSGVSSNKLAIDNCTFTSTDLDDTAKNLDNTSKSAQTVTTPKNTKKSSFSLNIKTEVANILSDSITQKHLDSTASSLTTSTAATVINLDSSTKSIFSVLSNTIESTASQSTLISIDSKITQQTKSNELIADEDSSKKCDQTTHVVLSKQKHIANQEGLNKIYLSPDKQILPFTAIENETNRLNLLEQNPLPQNKTAQYEAIQNQMTFVSNKCENSISIKSLIECPLKNRVEVEAELELFNEFDLKLKYTAVKLKTSQLEQVQESPNNYAKCLNHFDYNSKIDRDLHKLYQSEGFKSNTEDLIFQNVSWINESKLKTELQESFTITTTSLQHQESSSFYNESCFQDCTGNVSFLENHNFGHTDIKQKERASDSHRKREKNIHRVKLTSTEKQSNNIVINEPVIQSNNKIALDKQTNFSDKLSHQEQQQHRQVLLSRLKIAPCVSNDIIATTKTITTNNVHMKRLSDKKSILFPSSSVDDDKQSGPATHEFLSLSLSPPLNRRREMPALRGPFVSL